MDTNNVKCLKCQISCKICSRTMRKGSLKRHMKVHAKQLKIENNNNNDGQRNLYETYQIIITPQSPTTTTEKNENDSEEVYIIYKLLRLDREDNM